MEKKKKEKKKKGIYREKEDTRGYANREPDMVLRQWVPQKVQIFEWWEVENSVPNMQGLGSWGILNDKWRVTSDEWWKLSEEWWVMVFLKPNSLLATFQTDIIFFIPYFKYLPLSLSSSISLSLSLSRLTFQASLYPTSLSHGGGFSGIGRGSNIGLVVVWRGAIWWVLWWVLGSGCSRLLMGWSVVDGFGYGLFVGLAGFWVWWVWLWFVGGGVVWW